ncbi:hypothetical protein [Spirosoma pulveris]
MFLNFITIERDGVKKNYSWWVGSVEAAFDVLNSLVAKGRVVIQADLLEEQNRLRLDMDAFEGESFRHPMQQLQRQWQALLSVPIGDFQGGLTEVTLTSSTPSET